MLLKASKGYRALSLPPPTPGAMRSCSASLITPLWRTYNFAAEAPLHAGDVLQGFILHLQKQAMPRQRRQSSAQERPLPVAWAALSEIAGTDHACHLVIHKCLSHKGRAPGAVLHSRQLGSDLFLCAAEQEHSRVVKALGQCSKFTGAALKTSGKARASSSESGLCGSNGRKAPQWTHDRQPTRSALCCTPLAESAQVGFASEVCALREVKLCSIC